MWFQHPEYDGFYWLTNEEERDRGNRPGQLPPDAPVREMQEGDWTWDVFACHDAGGGLTTFRWVINNAFIGDSIKPNVEFPSLVTFQTLTDFFIKCSPKGGPIHLDENTFLSKNGGGEYWLQVKGQKILRWTSRNLTWHKQGSISQLEIDAINKYVGKNWKIAIKNDIVGFQGAKGDWEPVTPWTSLKEDGSFEGWEDHKSLVGRLITKYNQLQNSINLYVYSITLKKIMDSVGGMSQHTHSILTRCPGCQGRNIPHLEVHIARKDLDAYLIYVAYDAFGPKEGDSLVQTWSFITNPNPIELAKFQSYLYKFLLDSLRSSIFGLTFPSLNNRPSFKSWLLNGQARPDEEPRLRWEPRDVPRDVPPALRRAQARLRVQPVEVPPPVVIRRPIAVREEVGFANFDAAQLEWEGEEV